ncbi:hypothetical protein ACOSQ4_009251 [Xanthoceras sorbifolium]
MGASSSTCSSSSTTATHGGKYDLFVSFRGEDIRDSFRSHFCEALSRKKIDFFVDDKLNRGYEIWPALSKAIEDSRISVVIFSKDYASSKWCLRELVKILECKKTNGQIVIPVFYQVDPSHVRIQEGSFEDAFVNNHGKVSEDEKQKWRAALTEASNLSGFDSSSIRPESKFVSEIVRDIWKKLNNISFSRDIQGLIGIDERIEQVVSLLRLGTSDFRIVGIWGMGGIGKTTVADAIFKLISYQFEDPYFVSNVREESEKCGGLVRLREEVLSKVLNEGNLKLGGEPSISPSIKDRLNNKKVFIVLDDVDNFRSLEFLFGGLDRLGAGSRIIITTRDKQVLYNCGLNSRNIYEVKEFNYSESIQLFCNYALNQNHPPEDLIVLSNKVVNCAKGNPLALKLLGLSLKGKSKQEWESALNKLQRIFNLEIFDVLKISFNGLDDEEKDVFLNIACFFKGEDKDYVVKILGDRDDYSLGVLVNKSLIMVLHNKIQMHDLLQEMGREIVRQESPDRQGNRSRLWKQDDVLHVLKKDHGTDAVRGIFLDMSELQNTYLNSGAFKKMYNLRFLKFYDSPKHYFEGLVYNSRVHFKKGLFKKGLSYFSDELRSLNWLGYPLKELPSNFIPKNLVELRIPCSNLERLWKDTKHTPKLKWLILHDCPRLTKIPDLIVAPLLEEINLENCRSLLDICSSVHHLNHLRYLKLRGCESLERFPSNIHFESLISLDLSYCIKLTKFPQISGNIKMLYLCGTAIEEVPSSIQSLSNLVELNLSKCLRLKHISTSICKLKSLYELNLLDCSKLERFPEILETMGQLKKLDLEISEIMESLTQLDLSGTAIKELPPSIENLKWLWTLELSNCENLEKLPSSICNLRSLGDLYASNCPKLDKLPENLGNLKSLWRLDADRTAIDQLPSSLTSLENLEELDCSGCRGLTLPPMSGLLRSLRELILVDCNMTEIPEDIGCLSSLEELYLSGNDFESLPKSIRQLSSLWLLCLSKCNMLQSLPELPLGLSRLIAMDCKQLQSLPDAYHFADSAIECRSHGTTLAYNFVNCVKLDKKVCNNVFKESGHEQKVFNFNICFPGRDTPSWFSYQSFGSSVNIQLPLDSWGNRKLVGFALCVVLEFEERLIDYECDVCVNRKCYYKTKYGDRLLMDSTLCNEYSIDRYPRHSKIFSIELDHVVLSYYDFADLVKLSTDDYTIFSLQFKFSSSDNCKPNISNEIFDATNQDFAETSGSGRGRSDDHEEGLEPNPKRICT